MKNLIGRKVRGFKFEDVENKCYYTWEVKEYDGKIGEVYEVDINKKIFRLRFEDSETFAYPLSEIEKHLVEEKPTLEQVKEYFKNAKEVSCLTNGKIHEIIIDEINYDDYLLQFWYKGDVKLVDEEGKYAEIISYKENPKKIIVKDAEIVTLTDFDKVIKNTFNHIENLLLVKGKEYQRNGNVFHNFDSGANITGQTPERVLNGFLLKHLISYNDMLNDIENGKNPSEALVEEKLNDIITYFAIQKAQILKRIK